AIWRTRSTSSLTIDTAMTSDGSATRPTIQNAASLIPVFALVQNDRPSRQQDDVTQPRIETCQSPRQPHERIHDDAVQDTVEEAAFECEEKEPVADPIRRQRVERSVDRGRPVADGVLDSVQIVEDIGRAQELQQSKARVSSQMDEGDRVPANRNLNDD